MSDPEELVIRCAERPDTRVRLHDLFFPDEYGVSFSIELSADGLRAAYGPVSMLVWDERDLPDFVAGLADDFHGWAEPRTWRAGNHLQVVASFHTGGHVALQWTVWAGYIKDSWAASVTTWVEAGSQMSRLADDLRDLLPRPSGYRHP